MASGAGRFCVYRTCRFLSGRFFGRWASGSETFQRFLPHTPSSNASRSPALLTGVPIETFTIHPAGEDCRRTAPLQAGSRTRASAQSRRDAGRSDAVAQSTAPQVDDMNPALPGGERCTAESPKSRWSSGPFPCFRERWCGPLRQRSHRRSLSRRLRIPASGSKLDTPGFCPDPGAAEVASSGPERFVSAAGPAATAHSGVTAHFS